MPPPNSPQPPQFNPATFASFLAKAVVEGMKNSSANPAGTTSQEHEVVRTRENGKRFKDTITVPQALVDLKEAVEDLTSVMEDTLEEMQADEPPPRKKKKKRKRSAKIRVNESAT